MSYQTRRGEFLISTDTALIDLDAVHAFLARAYWCAGIPRDTVKRGIDNSMTFGLYDESARPRRQVGFARVVTDRATFAYLSDVFVIDEYRGRGLSKWLVEVILGHPDLQGLRRFCLLTRDAHGLYARYGFKPMPDPTRYMELWDPEVYTRPVAQGPDLRVGSTRTQQPRSSRAGHRAVRFSHDHRHQQGHRLPPPEVLDAR